MQYNNSQKQEGHSHALTPSPMDADAINVIGREEDLLMLWEKLKVKKHVMLTGFGGIGKTKLAQLLFHEYESKFDEVAWIDYQGGLRKSILACINDLRFLESKYQDEKERWNDVESTLANDGKRKLIIIDNVDSDIDQDPEQDTDLRDLTGWKDTTLLLTSRLDYLEHFEAVTLDALEMDNCIGVFKHYSRRNIPNLETVIKIIELANRHTLTIEILAKGVKRRNLETYYDTLVSKGFVKLDETMFTQRDKANATIEQYLRILFNMQKRSDEDKRILNSFAILPEKCKCSLEEIEQWFGFKDSNLDRVITDGWLSYDEENEKFFMHPLVRTIIRFDFDEDEQNRKNIAPKGTADKVLGYLWENNEKVFDINKGYASLQRMTGILESIIGTVGQNDEVLIARLYHVIGSSYDNLGDYDKALDCYGKSLKIKESMLGKDHPETTTTYNNIATVHYAKGDYDKALEYYEKTSEIIESKLGKDHPDTATTYYNIAEVYWAKGNYYNALEYYRKALEIRESNLGKDHSDTATTYNNIAGVYEVTGDYDKALEYYGKALEIRESKLGKDHPDTAMIYKNISGVYRTKGEYAMALKFINKAYLIYEKVFGPNHPNTISVSNLIALTTSMSRSNIQKLPIGLQNFEKLRIDKYAYVDKTHLVFDLVNYGKYFFLSRPRRFGKSLLISTLKAYFEGKKELFEGLTISELEKKWESSPVLYLDLNVGMYDSKEGLVETLNSNLNEWEEEFGIKSNSTDVAQRFRNIIKKVAKRENRNVVILVDEYDKPLLKAIDNESLQQEFREILKAFFSNLKTCDEFIRFAMLSGVSKFSKISLFSDLNNLTDISLNPRYANICGLTANEINETFSVYLDDFVKQEKTDKTTLLNKMRQMYGGYHFTESTSLDMYNPFSVLNAFLEKRFHDYWFETGTPTFLTKLLQNGDYNLQEFSEGKIKANNLAAKECLSEEPIALFYQTGYLTIKEYSKEFNNYSLGFPNREVEQGFLSFLFPRYTGKNDVRSTTFLERIMIDLHEGRIKDFLERMKSFFANTPYELIRDLENHYQNVLFIICRLTGYSTKAEYHTSDGRIDMVVKTEQYIYVFEFKFNKTAKEALEQIDTKEYLLPFRSDGRKLCKIGVNFSGKTNNIDGFIAIWEDNPPIVIRD